MARAGLARDLRVANAVRYRRRSGAWGWDEPRRAAEYRVRHADGLYLARFREDNACVRPLVASRCQRMSQAYDAPTE